MMKTLSILLLLSVIYFPLPSQLSVRLDGRKDLKSNSKLLKELNSPEKDSLLQYHPMQKGNKWIYSYYENIGSNHNEEWVFKGYIEREIISDTVIADDRYFVFRAIDYVDSSITTEYFCSDSIDIELIEPASPRRFRAIDFLVAKDTSTVGPTYFQVRSFPSSVIFSLSLPMRAVTLINEIASPDYLVEFRYYFGLGLAYISYENFFKEFFRIHLSYAKIGNNQYGDNPLSVQENKRITPTEFTLFQNYPNPFNPVTTIKYALTQTSFVSLKVYNVFGKEVATLVQGKRNAGEHSVQFDGPLLASGVYFYQIRVDNNSITKKALLLK